MILHRDRLGNEEKMRDNPSGESCGDQTRNIESPEADVARQQPYSRWPEKDRGGIKAGREGAGYPDRMTQVGAGKDRGKFDRGEVEITGKARKAKEQILVREGHGSKFGKRVRLVHVRYPVNYLMAKFVRGGEVRGG